MVKGPEPMMLFISPDTWWGEEEEEEGASPNLVHLMNDLWMVM